MRRGSLAIAAVIATCFTCLAEAADQYKMNPFTGKLDNVGNGIANSVSTSTGEYICPSYSGGVVTWAVCGVTADGFITEDGLNLITETGSDIIPE